MRTQAFALGVAAVAMLGLGACNDKDGGHNSAPAGTFDPKPENRAQMTGVLTNLILPGTVLVADIDKAIDNGKGKAVLATMAGGTLTATKEGGKTVLTDGAGHKAAITQSDEQ